MSEVTGVSNVDKNAYNTSNAKKVSGNSDFSSYLGESKTMDEIFREASEKYNVPVELLKAVGKAESNFNANAVSRCGAQGVMQLMPGTAKELGVTDSFNAEQNIMGGAKYISALLKRYDGNTKLAIAAYNAGSGNVAKYDGIPPFEETQNYVKKVMAYYGQGDLEITTTASASSSTSSSSAVRQTASPAPVQRNLSFLLNGSTDSNGINSLDSLFSYDDYLKFLELFLEEEDGNKANEQEEDAKSNYSAKEITYNASVMNLLKDQNLI
jgi:hypothetical protein